MTRLEQAIDYQRRGFAPLPIPPEAKNPGFKGWQNYAPLNGQFERDFKRDGNIGLLLGKPSNGLVDVDLDWPEACRLARHFLPATPMHSGRKSALNSHWWYRCDIKTEKFSDPNIERGKEREERAMIVEIRSTGCQTVVSPSVHPEGELYEWSGELEPAAAESQSLRRAVTKMAACALLARYWPKGRRHDVTLALAGALLRNGWTVEEVDQFVVAIVETACDEELDDRRQAVKTTAERVKAGATVTGLPTLVEIIGEKTVKALVKWLGLRGSLNESPLLNAQPSSPSTPLITASNDCSYYANGRGLIWNKPIAAKEGQATTVPVTLTNFVAHITADVERDDGTERSRIYEVTASLAGDAHAHKGTITAEEFDSLRWLNTILGARAVVYPGKGEHTRVAIRLLSEGIQARRVIAHTGWRNDGEHWSYYHGNGAINADGLIESNVELPPQFSAFKLPAPPSGSALCDAVRAVAFTLLKVAPENITLPLFGGAFAALLTDPDFSLFLVGYTGSGKSELAALLQSFFGAGFNAKALPAAWSSSANALEAIAHTAKDCVLVIDDFCPTGATQEQARLHAAADRIFRAQGNHSGRARCRTDGSVRPPKPPRGLAVGTGEDLPRGQSLRARLAILPIEKGAVNWPLMTECQQQARAGIYATATSAFIQWLAKDGRIGELRANAESEINQLRQGWLNSGVNAHKRSATTLAYLQRAWEAWLTFAADCGALDSDEVTGMREAIHTALDTLGRSQDSYHASENPTIRFIELLRAAIVSGRAHLAATNGGRPDDAEAWGWRGGEVQGDCVGWLDGNDLYLQPDAAYRIAQTMASNGEGLTISAQVLWKRLNEAGLLASVDEKRQTNKIRRTINGKAESVIHLSRQEMERLG